MMKKVNSSKLSETHLKVLSLFTKGYDKEFYIREVSKKLDVSSRTSRAVLDDLEQKGVLNSNERGKIKVYSLKENFLSMKYLEMAEKYKVIKFLEKDNLVKEVVDEIRKNIDGSMVLFGSRVKENHDKDSDLDVLVVGNFDRKRINKISETYGIDINLKKYSRDSFKKKDHLIKEVFENHIIVKGVESFLEVALNGQD